MIKWKRVSFDLVQVTVLDIRSEFLRLLLAKLTVQNFFKLFFRDPVFEKKFSNYNISISGRFNSLFSKERSVSEYGVFLLQWNDFRQTGPKQQNI